MPNGGYWTTQETQDIIKLYGEKPDYMSLNQWAAKVAPGLGKSVSACRQKASLMIIDGKLGRHTVKESPYPRYDEPLVMAGDAVILPDLEFPFHCADFVNRVLDLADKWQVRQCVMAGDVLHFDSLSGWEPNWTGPNPGGMTADAEAALMEFAKTLGPKQQGALMGLIGDIGQRTEQDGASTELSIARRELHNMESLFDRIDFVIGNHEGRLLRALETALNPAELLRLLEAGSKWRIAPYYFSYLDTPAGRYQIEHPKGAAESTAQGLAAKYHCHVIMAHSHLLDFTWDVSGEYYAIHAGHCVDEARLPYAAQRHTTRRSHKHGAVIVRDGYPWLLHDGSNWERLGKM